MRARCLCECHTATGTDRFRADGVDVTDPLEAAVACSRCQRHHCAALLSRQLACDPDLPTPTPRPASICWDGDDQC